MASCHVPLSPCNHALLGLGINILFVWRVGIRSRYLIFCKNHFEGTIKVSNIDQPEIFWTLLRV